MSIVIDAFLKTPTVENHVLFSLLFFLNCEDEDGTFNADAPISDIEPYILIVAVSLFESNQGINVPDSYITENKSKTLRQLAEEIRALPKLTDKALFQKAEPGYDDVQDGKG